VPVAAGGGTVTSAGEEIGMRRGVDFTHVIMTRFNMPTPGKESLIRSRPGWLAGRFELFERYCLPSIAAQTTRDFHWVVYFDVETPPEFRERIEACRAVFPFVPYFTEFFQAEGWPRSRRELLGQPTPWLLTTRFDSDDALAVDHAARLQVAVEAAAPTTRTSFNLIHGVVIEDGRVYAHAHPSNAFASWFEPWDAAARTCMSKLESGGSPADTPAAASRSTATSSRGSSSSSFTISRPRRAVVRQCTMRSDSPCSYSRTEWRSKPDGRRSSSRRPP
jgi:hypothetical protein